YKDMVQNFKNMEILHNILVKKRVKRGAIDFDLPECSIEINEFGRVVDVKRFERNTAHKLIESFMLEANETVAEHVCNIGLPFMFRVHEQPDSMKMGNFFALLSSIGEHIKSTPEKVTPKQLQQLLGRVEGKPYNEVVKKVMLRSLQKARYASKNLGHYGLAAEFYCHFTSPIRRYPDLMVHRILKNCVLNKPDQSRLDFYSDFVVEACQLSSEREQLAESASRAVDDLKKAEFMLDKIGKRYSGTISGATSFGVFVELDNTVEGMCAIADLPEDDYVVIENQYMLKGKRHQYQLGGKVEVEVLTVNLKRRQINFKIIDDKCKKQENSEENVENEQIIEEIS
ncbi:MAG: RNB domain-containing ribonuclease, partial [Clostridia bacterium]|nr:RNB domain-containing ribonuclease [Clostridia bacterium]